MAEENPFPESNLLHHTQKIKEMLWNVIEYLREDIHEFDEPQAAAMFETSAEVLQGLITAIEHYEQQSDEAWQKR
jgi:hypothetical protein